MTPSGFIASRLRFKGRIAGISIAVSFLVMILALCISQGFRAEIRDGLSASVGDVRLSDVTMDIMSEEHPINVNPSFRPAIDSLPEVKGICAAIYRAGIVRKGGDIHGVVFKGCEGSDSLQGGGVLIPSRLSQMLGVKVGDKLPAYFVGERLKARVFTVKGTYNSLVQTDENLVVRGSIEDLRLLNGWESDQASVLEVTLADDCKNEPKLNEVKQHIGSIALLGASDSDDTLVSLSLTDIYPQLFDWIGLIDFNVWVILILMTIVAGFNMISGLLIMLFRSISTIGTLKALGMTNKGISAVFLKVSSVLVLKGMLWGNGLALLFCLVQNSTHLLKLDPANYFVSFVPVHVDFPLILAADAVAFVAIMLLLYIPCLFIAKVDPAKTVKAE